MQNVIFSHFDQIFCLFTRYYLLRTAIPESFGNDSVYILEDIALVMPCGIFCTPLDAGVFTIIILANSLFYNTPHFAHCSIVFYANWKIAQPLSFHKVQSLIPNCWRLRLDITSVAVVEIFHSMFFYIHPKINYTYIYPIHGFILQYNLDIRSFIAIFAQQTPPSKG